MKTGYAPLDGLKMYYEIHGEGQPLVHGGVVGIAMFGGNVDALAKGREVIAVELQGHGHTADIDRPLSFEAMADGIAGLVKYLRLQQVDVMGYSLGGGVALQVAIRHPEGGAKAGSGFYGIQPAGDVSRGAGSDGADGTRCEGENETVALEQDVSGHELGPI